MPDVENSGVRLHYEVSGKEEGDLLMLANSLGSNLHMWDKVLVCFEDNFRVIRFDTRGHGSSSAPMGPYRIEELGRDVLLLLDCLGIERASFCGLSLGGMVGMWLGIHAPQRVKRLVLANTGARIGTPEMWEERIAVAKKSGMAALAEMMPARWFTSGYREAHPEEMKLIREMVSKTDSAGYSACCAALRDTDLRSEIAAVSAPCLVITGKHDLATPPSEGQAVHRALPKAKYVELEASHLSAWERAAEFGAEVVAFLETGEVRMDERERHAAGMRVRREVLGDAHVERAEASKSELDTEFQDLITRFAWGEIWTRPGLSRHTRSLLTIGLMVALNRGEELRLHIRAARNNGVTGEEIREVLLHCAGYCGIPAANSAFHIAREILKEQEGQK